jgi:flavin-dependent dehydrogenase
VEVVLTRLRDHSICSEIFQNPAQKHWVCAGGLCKFLHAQWFLALREFIAAGGPQGYAWNVVRSEADDLMFRHAGESGAKIFDGVKVNSIQFVDDDAGKNAQFPEMGRPVSARWSQKDGTSGSINFEYIVDASGRAGIVSTKYMKNRKFNQGLKNIAAWAYWEGAETYAVGTHKEGCPVLRGFGR